MPLIRVTLSPNRGNGLKEVSQVMVDKVTAVSRERIRQIAGRITASQMKDVNDVLRHWLDLGAAD